MSLTLPLTDRLGACLRPLLMSNAGNHVSSHLARRQESPNGFGLDRHCHRPLPVDRRRGCCRASDLAVRHSCVAERTGRSRWYDRVWLSWLALAIYLLHNVEEYGIDVFGRMTQFPTEICSVLKLPAPPDCPIPASYFLSVNINGNIGSAALVGTQLANAALFLLIPWVAENWRGGVLIRPGT
jgi:hypothetical protein